jgi:hypothetical protein
MAISYVNSLKSPSSFPGSSNNTDTATISKPVNTAQDDVMIAFIVTVSGALMSTVPSGWTLVDNTDNGSNLQVWVYRKIAGASEPASYTWIDDSGGIGPMCGLVSSWRGCDISGNPVDTFAAATSTTTDPVTTPTITTTSASCLPIHFACSRTTNNVATQGTYTNGSGQTERMNPANRGGSTEYYAELSSSTAATHVGPGSQTGVTFDSDTNHAPSNGIRYQLALKASVPPTNAPAEGVSATITAYNPASLTTTTTSAYSAVTVTAYNATVLTGVAAENTGSAGAVVTAYNAAGWVIHPVAVGIQAFNASVAIGTEAEHATASVTAYGGVGYFGAPKSRTWRIDAEDRTWRVAAESRAWTIPAEDRSWRIPSKDN